MKRVFDIAVALIGIVLCTPFLIIISLCVYSFMGSPVLFRQTRPGLAGKPFTLLKFRTMATMTSSEVTPDAERLTPFGKFLRSSSLDELPELINVLRGEMSLVGPRPLLMEYLTLYSADQARRHAVRPGITGWAQVNGRNALDWEQRFQLDVWYVDNRSFMLDLKILFMTISGVFAARGISQPGHATMERFRGTKS